MERRHRLEADYVTLKALERATNKTRSKDRTTRARERFLYQERWLNLPEMDGDKMDIGCAALMPPKLTTSKE